MADAHNAAGSRASDEASSAEPVMILELKPDSSEVVVLEEGLDRIHKAILDAKADFVSVVSVMGEYRTGKSFLLGFLLRFLKKKMAVEAEMRQEYIAKKRAAQTVDESLDFEAPEEDEEEEDEESIPILDDYLDLKGKLYAEREPTWKFGADDRKKHPLPPWVFEGDAERLKSEKQSGFIWRHGQERCTQGIWIWSQPFVFKDAQGRKIGVLLMDTQGAWDDTMTRAQSGTIFGLTALLSSTLIYNIQNRVSEVHIDNMDYITTFTENVCNGLQRGGSPFGRLQCLVRDWVNYQDDWTMEQCTQDVNEHMQKHFSPEKVRSDAKPKVERLQVCFRSISCFALCEPGSKVKNAKYDGSLAVIDNDFFQLLDEFVRTIFADGFPAPSAPLGCEISAAGFKQNVLNFAKTFQDKSEDMAIGLREAFVNVQINHSRDTLLKEFKTKFGAFAPEMSVIDPAKLKLEATKLRNAYHDEFVRVLQPFKLEAAEEQEKIAEFMNQLEGDIKQRSALNQQALEGANVKIAAAPVVGCGGYFLLVHHWLLAIVATAGGWLHFKKKAAELDKEMADPEVIKGVFSDVKEFGKKRYRDVQAMQVAANTCNPNTVVDDFMRSTRGVGAMAAAAAATAGANNNNANANSN